MGISVAGIASGIDSDGIISQLMALENQRVMQIQKRIAAEEMRRAAYDDLSGRVNSLRSAAGKFSESGLFGELNASSTDPSVISATAKDGASTGTYKVEVLQTAQANRIAAQGFIDDSSTGIALESGTFSYKTGNGTVTEIEVDENTSLKQLATSINEASSNVRASIVKDGSGLNQYRLVLTSKSTGRDGEVKIVENDTVLDFENNLIEEVYADEDNADAYLGTVTSGGTYTGTDNTAFLVEIIEGGAADGTAKYRYSTDGGLTFLDNNGQGFDVLGGVDLALADGVTINFEDNGVLTEGDAFSIDVFHPELDEARDAMFKVNGISIRKSGNFVNDVFEGISFNLASAEPGKEVSIIVSQKTGDVEAAMTGFLGAYNGVVGFLRSQFNFDPQSGAAAPPLSGDSAARQVDRDIRRIISMRMPGLDGEGLSSIAELGIRSNEKTGILSFDAFELSKALTDNPDGVRRVLTRFGERLNGDFEFSKRTANSKPGTYGVEVTQARTRASVMADSAAEALAVGETVTVEFSRRATSDIDQPLSVDVTLEAGDSVGQQVSRFNEALQTKGFEAEVFLDAAGRLNLRSTEYGADYFVAWSSTAAQGAGTSNIGAVKAEDQGTDLKGNIGGNPATTVRGNRLKGDRGFSTEGIEVIMPDDVDGEMGEVRIVDGLSDTLADIVQNLTGSNGVINSRQSGVNNRIADYEAEIEKHVRRAQSTEDRLRKQFVNLEMTMGKLNALGDYITQQLENLPGASSKKK